VPVALDTARIFPSRCKAFVGPDSSVRMRQVPVSIAHDNDRTLDDDEVAGDDSVDIAGEPSLLLPPIAAGVVDDDVEVEDVVTEHIGACWGQCCF
jgi:hypothetical protein